RGGERRAVGVRPLLPGLLGEAGRERLPSPEPPRDEVTEPIEALLLVVADPVEDDEVLERLDAGVDDLHERADASTVLRLLRKERRVGVQLLEELEDGRRLDVFRAVDDEAREVSH